ncbi:MAG: ISL3 family transposase, partial [Deltaproteobacteria bacterium]|nr:ISL3 family transposase [Deltaproteobacteria bacterium]
MIEITRVGRGFRCPCGRVFERYYDWDERLVRDLSFGPFSRAFLIFPQFRVECPECGVKTEVLDWIEPRARYTKRLAAAVAISCREIRSLSAIGKQFDLDWKTVKQIDKKALLEELPPVGETDATILAVDEFAVKKRHKYGTTVIDATKAEVLYVGQGRTEDTLNAFYKAMGEERCEKVDAVAMDMWQPFENATRKHCPKARIVYDPFHIIKNYGSLVVDRVRIDEAKEADKEGKKLIKGSKYLLLKNKENLSGERDEPAR